MKPESDGTTTGMPDWVETGAEPFDVRPLLAQGEDPLLAIMARIEKIAPDDLLVIDAPFNPAPLRRMLASQGFSSFGRKLADGHWRVTFRRDGGRDWEGQCDVDVSPEGAMSWREGDGLHIDVRKLTPPQPMLAILRLLDGLKAAEPVVVHHDRMPHLLIPELAERGWHIAQVVEEFANLRLWLEPIS